MIYFLATVGAVTLFGIAGMIIAMFIIYITDKGETERTIYCALTCKRCIYDDMQEGKCSECPIAEEAEKIGNR